MAYVPINFLWLFESILSLVFNDKKEKNPITSNTYLNHFWGVFDMFKLSF